MPTVTQLVAAQRNRIENLTAARLREALGEGDATVIDIREPAEIADTGTIPNAVPVPRGLLEFRADPTSPSHDAVFDPRVRTVLFCASGGRSALAAGTLLDLGYQHVAHLDGGIAAWMDAGFEVVGG